MQRRFGDGNARLLVNPSPILLPDGCGTRPDRNDWIVDCAKRVCQRARPNVVTRETVELDLWATKERAEDARDLEREIRTCFGEGFGEGKLQRLTLNRKLILGSIECVDDY